SDFIRAYIAEKRKIPADDLISELIAAEESGAKLSTDELITTCILLLNAGHEATVHTIGNGVKTLLETGIRPGASVDALAEEIMRFDPPLHMFTRYAYEDVTLFDHQFKRGDQVACLLAASGRDPTPYPDPASFDPYRKRLPHHAFGAGIHFCVGAPLARLELDIAFRTLFARAPDIALAEKPRYANVYHFHGLERLLVSNAKG
ncbi:MAG: cytochrome P450, partial [Deltaproteobacteria bacterium]